MFFYYRSVIVDKLELFVFNTFIVFKVHCFYFSGPLEVQTNPWESLILSW